MLPIFLKSPSGGEGRLKFGASRLLGDAIASLDKDRLGTMFKGAVKKQAVGLDIATPMGQILDVVMAENRHGPLIDSTIRWAYRTLDANEVVIRNIVTDRANAVMRWTGLDDRVANEVLDGLYKLLADMAADPHHPVRAKTEESLAQLAGEVSRHDNFEMTALHDLVTLTGSLVLGLAVSRRALTASAGLARS